MVIKDFGANMTSENQKVMKENADRVSAVFYGSVCPENRTQSRYSVSQLNNRQGRTVESAIGKT